MIYLQKYSPRSFPANWGLLEVLLSIKHVSSTHRASIGLTNKQNEKKKSMNDNAVVSGSGRDPGWGRERGEPQADNLLSMCICLIVVCALEKGHETSHFREALVMI